MDVSARINSPMNGLSREPEESRAAAIFEGPYVRPSTRRIFLWLPQPPWQVLSCLDFRPMWPLYRQRTLPKCLWWFSSILTSFFILPKISDAGWDEPFRVPPSRPHPGQFCILLACDHSVKPGYFFCFSHRPVLGHDIHICVFRYFLCYEIHDCLCFIQQTRHNKVPDKKSLAGESIVPGRQVSGLRVCAFPLWQLCHFRKVRALQASFDSLLFQT